MREPAEVEQALDRALAELGRIDIVVNGAAGNFLAPAAQLSYNGFKTVMAIDALGTFNVSRAAFDKRLRDHGGHILNVSATLHYTATPLLVVETSQFEPETSDDALDDLVKQIGSMTKGTRYYVPRVGP